MPATIHRVEHSEDVKLGLIVYTQHDGEVGDVFTSTEHEVARRATPETTVVLVNGRRIMLMDLLRCAGLV